MSQLIYIADDEENIRFLIKSFLEKNNYLVRDFSNGNDLLEAFYQKPADLVILDSMMPGMDGVSASAILRKLSSAPIIMVSALGSEIDKVTALKVGCDDYLTKPFSPLELTARVQSIFRRIHLDHAQEPPSHSTTLLHFGDLSLDEKLLTATIQGEPIKLTQTEFPLLVYLIKNSDRAISREELLRKVWRYSGKEIDTRATDDTIKRLRKKLSEYHTNVNIETVRGYGFRIWEAAEV